MADWGPELGPGDLWLSGRDTLWGSAAAGLQSQLRPSPCTSFIYMPCMLMQRHPSHSHGWTLGLKARPGEMACRCSEVKCRHSRDASRCMIPEPLTARDAFLSVTKLPRCFSVRNVLPPFPSLENFKNMILSSLGYLEVTTPEGREESKRKEREPAERPSVYLSSSSPSGLLCSCRLTPQISDASSWCSQMQCVYTRV